MVVLMTYECLYIELSSIHPTIQYFFLETTTKIKIKKNGCPYNTIPHKLFEISQFYTLLLLLLLLLKSSLESWNIILKINSRMYNSIYKNNHNKCLLISIEKNMYERKKKYILLNFRCIA